MSYYEISEIIDLRHLASTSTLHFHANAIKFRLLRGQLGTAATQTGQQLTGSNDSIHTELRSLEPTNKPEIRQQPIDSTKRQHLPLPDSLMEAMLRESQALHGQRQQKTQPESVASLPETNRSMNEVLLVGSISNISEDQSKVVPNTIPDMALTSDTSDSLPDVLLLDTKRNPCFTLANDAIPSEQYVKSTSVTKLNDCAARTSSDVEIVIRSETREESLTSCAFSIASNTINDILLKQETGAHQLSLVAGESGRPHDLSRSDDFLCDVASEKRTNRFVRSDEKLSKTSRESSTALRLHHRKTEINRDLFCRRCKARLTPTEVADGLRESERLQLASEDVQDTTQYHEHDNGDVVSVANCHREATHFLSHEDLNLSPRSQRRREWKAKRTICRMNPNLDSFDIIPGWGDEPMRQIQWEETVPREIWSQTIKAVQGCSQDSAASWLTAEIDEAKRRVGSPAATGRLEQWLDDLRLQSDDLIEEFNNDVVHRSRAPSSACSVSTQISMRPAVE